MFSFRATGSDAVIDAGLGYARLSTFENERADFKRKEYIVSIIGAPDW